MGVTSLSLLFTQNEHFVMEVGKQPVIFENPMYAAKDNPSKVAPAAQVRCHVIRLSAVTAAPSFRDAECSMRLLACPPKGRKHRGLYFSFAIHSHKPAQDTVQQTARALGRGRDVSGHAGDTCCSLSSRDRAKGMSVLEIQETRGPVTETGGCVRNG